MKRVDFERKAWNIRHAAICRKRRRKSLERRRRQGGRRRTPARVSQNVVKLPRSLCFQTNHQATAAALAEIRGSYAKDGTGARRLFIDFAHVEAVGASAALALAAEVDRWRTVGGVRPRVWWRHWVPSTRRLLGQMGLFDLVKTNAPGVRSVKGGINFLKFRTGRAALGQQYQELRKELVSLGMGLQRNHRVYAGVVEAMKNVVHHAYDAVGYDAPEDAPPHDLQRWWMSASYNPTTGILNIMFCDQGVGIPNTLPRRHGAELVNGVLGALGLSSDDASMIKAAIEMGRTRTGERHRGRGLPQVVGLVDQFADGEVRILSNRGEFIYRSGGKEELHEHITSICGTLINWRFTVGLEVSDKRSCA